MDNKPLNSTLSSSPETRDFLYAFKESWLKELGWQMTILFSILEGMSNVYGYCFASNETLAAKCGVSEKRIEDYLTRLQEKKWIYRNTYQTRTGSKRHIVTKSHFMTYWQKVLNRPSMAEIAKRKFLTFMDLVSRPSPDDPTPESEGPRESSKVRGACNRVCKVSMRTDAPPFLEHLKGELESSKLEPEKVQKALQWAEVNVGKVETLDNPVGWIRRGAEEGWLFSKKRDEKSEKAAAAERALEEVRRIGDPSSDVTLTEKGVLFTFYPTPQKPKQGHVLVKWESEQFGKSLRSGIECVLKRKESSGGIKNGL